jgi:hypothetical protein
MGRSESSGNLIQYAPARLKLFNEIHAESRIFPLIWTVLTLSRPCGTQFEEVVVTQISPYVYKHAE